MNTYSVVTFKGTFPVTAATVSEAARKVGDEQNLPVRSAVTVYPVLPFASTPGQPIIL